MTQNQYDHRLVVELNKGNSRVLSAIYHRFHAPLCKFARHMVTDEAEAEDIVIESFVKLWQSHSAFHSLANVRAFLFLVTRNAALNYLKHVQRRANSLKELAYLEDELEEPRVLPTLETEKLQQIYQEMEKLPPRCSRICEMIYKKGMTKKEIAGQLKISANTVKNHNTKALQLVRTALAKSN